MSVLGPLLEIGEHLHTSVLGREQSWIQHPSGSPTKPRHPQVRGLGGVSSGIQAPL
jgi:hypothetical protein